MSNTIAIGIAGTVFLKGILKQSGAENLEFLTMVGAALVLIFSGGLVFNFTMRLFGQKIVSEVETSKTELRKTLRAVGFVAVILLAIVTDLSIINVRVISMGAFLGFGIAIYSLLGKGSVSIWNSYRKRKNQKYFDELNDRPENRRRNSVKK